MKLLVIGSGGREHALAWKLTHSPRVSKVYVAPGNAGTALEEGLENVNITSHAELIEFVRREQIALTVVGPEAPLAAGIVDVFRARGLRIFGPTKAAAQLESSKDFAKAFMQRHRIPTAAFETFTDAAAAHKHVDLQGVPIVIKEVPCVKDKCPPIETSIMAMEKNAPPRAFKVQKPITEITFDHIYDLIENPMPCC